jgi:hypothetical protein
MFRLNLFVARVLPLGVAAVWLAWQATLPETAVSRETWFLVLLSALANVIVLTYHFAIPAHPKFLMRPWRRFVLRVHIVSGTVELFAGLGACFFGSTPAAVVMAVAALCFHVPSAFLQLPIVFGSRAIMEPAYLLCIVTHGFCAAMLLAHPDSHGWAVRTFLVFNIYVWCRVYFYLFDLLRLFRPMKYSAAILAAGFTVLPAALGPTGIIACIGFIGLYVCAHRILVFSNPADYEDFTRERARDTTLPAAMLERLDAARPEPPDDPDGATSWFRYLDSQGTGRLDRDAVLRALAPWGLPAVSAGEFVDRLLRAGPVTLEQFRENIWSIGAIRQHARRALALEQATTDREKAEMVFTLLDLDGDRFLSPKEINWLLSEWGLPSGESRHYLKRAANAEGLIALPAFITHLEPVWRFVFDEVLRAGFSRDRNEMIQRGAATALGSLRASSLRGLIRRELLHAVPFLAGADEVLIGNLAASLTVERRGAGEVVMREGEPGNTFYMVAEGTVRVERGGSVVATLRAGGSIGEGALLTSLPRSATVVTNEPAVLFALARPAFVHLTGNYPEVRSHLQRLHDERQRSNLQRLQPA